MMTSLAECSPWILSWLKCVKDSGNYPLWVTFGRKQISDEMREFIKREHIEHIYLPALSFERLPFIYRKFKQEIPVLTKKFSVDAAISGEFFWISTLVFRMFSTKIFYSYTYENHPNGILKEYSGLFSKLILPIANKVFKRVIVPVKSTRKCWEKIGLKNIVVCPLGVDLKFFTCFKNILSDRLKILYVGRVTSEKGLEYLLKAVSSLNFPYSLTIVGSGKINYFQKLASNFGCNVTFLGPVEYRKLPQIYREHNVFVLPSITTPYWKEQFGIVLTEAMATGRIVIGSNSGAIPEVMGDAGFIVPERTVRPLAEMLDRIYRDEEIFKIMSEKARQRAEEYFDLRKNTKKLIQMLENDLQ